MTRVYTTQQLVNLPFWTLRERVLELRAKYGVLGGELRAPASRADLFLWRQLRTEVERRGEQLVLFP
jgi:hypothetical protein